MRRKDLKEDAVYVVFAVRLKPATITEIRDFALADRRPRGQWLRNLIEDGIAARKARKVIK